DDTRCGVHADGVATVVDAVPGREIVAHEVTGTEEATRRGVGRDGVEDAGVVVDPGLPGGSDAVPAEAGVTRRLDGRVGHGPRAGGVLGRHFAGGEGDAIT